MLNKKNVTCATLLLLGMLFGNFTTLAATHTFLNATEAKKWGEKNYQQWTLDLTKREKEALYSYTKYNYSGINEALRKGTVDSYTNIPTLIKDIDSALNKEEVPEDITVYHYVYNSELGKLLKLSTADLNSLKGIKKHEKYIKQAIPIVNELINKRIIYPAYLSTSLLKNFQVNEARPIRFEIKVPKGTKAAFLGEKVSAFPKEQELLIARDSKFDVMGVSTVFEGGRTLLVIKADLVLE